MSFFDVRNNFKKVYTARREPSRPVQVSVSGSSVVYTFDSNAILRHRDCFIIRDINSVAAVSSGITGLYDEGVIFLSAEDSKGGTFSFVFPSTPIVVLSMDPGTGSTENVIPYLLTVTPTGFTAGISAVHTGYVRYRAVSAATYPATILTGGVIVQCYASGAVVTGSTVYTASYTLSGIPTWVGITTFDTGSNRDVDVYTTSGSFTPTSFAGDISAPLNNTINFIAHL